MDQAEDSMGDSGVACEVGLHRAHPVLSPAARPPSSAHPQTLPLHPQSGGPEAWLDLGSCFSHGPGQSPSQLYTEKELGELVR